MMTAHGIRNTPGSLTIHNAALLIIIKSSHGALLGRFAQFTTAGSDALFPNNAQFQECRLVVAQVMPVSWSTVAAYLPCRRWYCCKGNGARPKILVCLIVPDLRPKIGPRHLNDTVLRTNFRSDETLDRTSLST